MQNNKLSPYNDNGEIILKIGDEEMIKMNKHGFYFNGEKVDDVYEVYRRFNYWLNNAEKNAKDN